MLSIYLDVLLGSATRGVWKAMDRIPRAINVDVAQTKSRRVIAKLNKENERLHQELTTVQRDFDVLIDLSESIKVDIEMVTQENQTLERKNEDLQTNLKKDKEGRKKVNEEVVVLSSRLDSLRSTKMELEASLDRKIRENEKMLTKLEAYVEIEEEAIPKVVSDVPTIWSEEYEADPMKFLRKWGEEIGSPSVYPKPITVIPPTAGSQVLVTSDAPPAAPVSSTSQLPLRTEMNASLPSADVNLEVVE
ncbi:hypothetical protein Dimus_031580 [Dionaea muscipula]